MSPKGWSCNPGRTINLHSLFGFFSLIRPVKIPNNTKTLRKRRGLTGRVRSWPQGEQFLCSRPFRGGLDWCRLFIYRDEASGLPNAVVCLRPGS